MNKPKTRIEKYLAEIASGAGDDLPQPICVIDEMLKKIAENGTGKGLSKIVLQNNVDLNDIVKTGMYASNRSINIKNSPKNRDYGSTTLIVISGDEFAVQIFAISDPSFYVYVRSAYLADKDIPNDATDWNEWYQLATSEEIPINDTWQVYYNDAVCTSSDLTVRGILLDKRAGIQFGAGVVTVSGDFTIKSDAEIGNGTVICDLLCNVDESKIYNHYPPKKNAYTPIYSDSGVAGMAALLTTGKVVVWSVGSMIAGQKYHINATYNF